MFLVAFAILAWHAGRPGIGTSYVDPIDKIEAQAEAMYAAGIFNMVDRAGTFDDWMTPRFVGRFALWKPPLLHWMSAISIKILGRSTFALRVPSIAAGAATVALIYWWLLADSATIWIALTGAMLLLSSHLFFISARIAMMDALLPLEIALAMYALSRDPRLESRKYLWMFGAAAGAAIATKALAGTLPLIILGAMWVLSRDRARLIRILQAAVIAALVGSPWFLYQFIAHHRWFVDEHLLTEVLAYGMQSPPQDAQEPQLRYYASHLFLLDPVLFVAALVALIRTLKKGTDSSVPIRNAMITGTTPVWTERSVPLFQSKLLLIWIAIVFAAALAFQYRNDAYLAPLYPALALLVASAIPKRFGVGAAVAAMALFAVKAIAATQVWGLPFEPEVVNPSLSALDQYAAQKRGNDLAIIEMDDNFYSACLDLPEVRYIWIDPTPPRHFPLDFIDLGVLMSAKEFSHLPESQPEFARRLKAEGLDSTAPIGTSILARNGEEIGELIRSHPRIDFFLPKDWAAIDQGVHEQSGGTGDRVFLLSREKIQRP